ncbi:MAG: retroviral-like aspartic protease family protein [Candidatus Obscuribacter sp.]|nr:retroviral-like aspartic protease family protein [Candidatus Melainabacteria bacterium]MDX1988831.1 retroviral-like aspartic protease family protein [Candidatus Obscuribacter sp.]
MSWQIVRTVFRLGLFLLFIGSLLSLPLSAFAQGMDEGVKLFNSRNYEGAVKKFSALVQTQPNSADAYYYLGASCHRSGRTADARRYYDYIMVRFPGSKAAEYAKTAAASLAPAGASTAEKSDKKGAAGKDSASGTKDRINEIGELQGPDEDRVPLTVGNNGHMFVPVTMNGRRLEMIYDTGAEATCVSLSAWTRAGNKVPARPADDMMRGTGGVDGFWIEPVTFGMGKFSRTMNISIIKSLPQGMDGLVGQNFFKDLQYNLTGSANYIHLLRKNSRTASTSVPYNTIDVPFTRAGNNMHVMVNVNGHPLEMTFDTGCGTTSISRFQASAIGLRATDGQYYEGSASGVGGSHSVIGFRVESINLQGIEKRNFMITTSSNNFNLLGMDFLGDRRFVIDNEKSLIRFFR